jgi:hypothetical protein
MGKTTTPLEPKPITHSRSPSFDVVAASPPKAQPMKASLSSATPHVGTPLAKPTDKEREKLLYPGRVNLTSKPFSSVGYMSLRSLSSWTGRAGSGMPLLDSRSGRFFPPNRISTNPARILYFNVMVTDAPFSPSSLP